MSQNTAELVRHLLSNSFSVKVSLSSQVTGCKEQTLTQPSSKEKESLLEINDTGDCHRTKISKQSKPGLTRAGKPSEWTLHGVRQSLLWHLPSSLPSHWRPAFSIHSTTCTWSVMIMIILKWLLPTTNQLSPQPSIPFSLEGDWIGPAWIRWVPSAAGRMDGFTGQCRFVSSAGTIGGK